MSEDKLYIIKPHIFILSFDDIYGKSYILSTNNDNIEPINYVIDDTNKINWYDYSILKIKEYIKIPEIEINLNLIDLHSLEIERFYQTNNIIYPLYGANTPLTDNIQNAYWKEYSILEPNHFSYSITKVLQNSIL